MMEARGMDPVAGSIGRPLPHESAHLHVTGQATYVDDIPEVRGTLHCALGLSPVAHGRLLAVDKAQLLRLPGVVAVLCAADIPGQNQCGPILKDDPILAENTVKYVGQPVLAVVATERRLALRAAAQAAQAMTIEPLAAILSAREAHAQGHHVVPAMKLSRGDAASALESAVHRLSGTQVIGGQEQFYLEGQISYAIGLEDQSMRVHCSTQHPSEMQHLVAAALGVGSHHVQVECRRMGGGFGGKESQSALFACVAAVAARLLGRPVKLRVDRDDDFMVTGRRHPFEVDWEVGFDDRGVLQAARALFISNAGCSADLSAPVMTRAICHFDNAYYLPHVELRGFCARTNTQSNTAFRGFGGPQGALVIEAILDGVARRLGLDPLEVRRRNLYGRTPAQGRSTAPYGQEVQDNILHELIDDLAQSAQYERRRREIAEFNATSPVIKKGLALTPVKFGISFNLAHLNQAGALVHVYTDGTVLVNHGGTEMGQGLNTKVAQVVAHELGLDVPRVRVTATDTHKVANTSATAASTGSDLNGMAARAAAQTIAERLCSYWAEHESIERSQVRLADNALWLGGARKLSFEAAVAGAYTGRVQLWSDGFYATPGLHWDRETMTGRPFHYYAYGASVSEVLLDTLTGESRVVSADILHDVGQSLNPALDIGQIEGGYVQGMGWMTMEELWWHPRTLALQTHAPSTYKIPCANDVPPMGVRLFGRPNEAETIHRSKAVGEPPLLLSFSVLMAIRDALCAAATEAGPARLSAMSLPVPATPQAVIEALRRLREGSP